MEFFKHTKSIAKRLIKANLIIALFFLIGAASVYISSREFLKGITELRDIVQINESIRKIKNLFPIMQEAMDQADNKKNGTNYEDVFINAYNQSEILLKESINLIDSEEIRLMLILSQDQMTQFKLAAQKAFSAGKSTPADKLITSQFAMESIDNMNKAQIMMTERSNNTFNSIYEIRYRPIIMSLVLTVVFLVMALGLGFNISTRINKSIRNLMIAIGKASQGDLSFRAPIIEDDELGLVTNAFNQMSERLQKSTVSNEYVENILDSMLDTLLVLDDEGVILKANQAALGFLGYPDDELTGKKMTGILPEIQLNQKHIQNFETTCITKKRNDVPVFVSLSQLQDVSVKMGSYVCIIKDITERKKAERRLEEQNLELDQANKELEAFSYSVSHDLRAPLRAIDGFGQALIEDYGDKIDGEGHRYIDRIRSGTQRMGKLIDDILKLSRISRAELILQPVNLSELVESVIEEQQSLIEGRRIEFKITPHIIAEADPSLIKIVFDNLIGNSIKYTSRHEDALIEFGSMASLNGEKVYFVRDDGAGFDMNYSQKLFGAFQRLHLDKEFPGTGVGLATVQRIIHRHRGRIWAEGKVEKGATFFFTLGLMH